MEDKDYLDLKNSESTDDQISAEKHEQSVLFNKNSKAIMQAINAQNTKLAEYQQKLVAVSAQISMLSQELNRIKQIQIDELITKMGTGPTA